MMTEYGVHDQSLSYLFYFIIIYVHMVSNGREPVVTYAKPAAGGVGGPSRMRRGILPYTVSYKTLDFQKSRTNFSLVN